MPTQSRPLLTPLAFAAFSACAMSALVMTACNNATSGGTEPDDVAFHDIVPLDDAHVERPDRDAVASDTEPDTEPDTDAGEDVQNTGEVDADTTPSDVTIDDADVAADSAIDVQDVADADDTSDAADADVDPSCGLPCETSNPCEAGVIDCTAATPTCVSAGPLAEGTACRAAESVCDVAEVCDGESLACPTDSFAPDSTVCRAAFDACDAAEYCTGDSATCPADVDELVGTPCDDGFCDADGACSDTCVPGVACDPGVACRMGVISCASGAPVCELANPVDDGTVCGDDAVALGPCEGFADTCATGGTQSRTTTRYTCYAGTCSGADETDTVACERVTDGDPCGDGRESSCSLADACAGGVCVPRDLPDETPCGPAPVGACDATDACVAGVCEPRLAPNGTACGDGRETACDAADSCWNGTCESNQAATGASCDDGDACTPSSTCDASGVCSGVTMTCDDGDECTTDACVGGSCTFTLRPDRCRIGGNCLQAGQPFDRCSYCDPTRSQTSYSLREVNDYCHNGYCEGWCRADGTCWGPTPPSECF